MFGLGTSELIVIGILALILIGPKELPVVAQKVGKFLNEIRNAGENVRADFRRNISELHTDVTQSGSESSQPPKKIDLFALEEEPKKDDPSGRNSS